MPSLGSVLPLQEARAAHFSDCRTDPVSEKGAFPFGFIHVFVVALAPSLPG